MNPPTPVDNRSRNAANSLNVSTPPQRSHRLQSAWPFRTSVAGWFPPRSISSTTKIPAGIPRFQAPPSENKNHPFSLPQFPREEQEMDQDFSPLAAPLPAQSEEEGMGAGAPCSCRGTDIFPHVLFSSPQGHLEDFAITPRRRSGQDRRAPVVLTRELIESYFTMPLSAASKDLVGLPTFPQASSCHLLFSAFFPTAPAANLSHCLPLPRAHTCPTPFRVSVRLRSRRSAARWMGISKWPFR